MSKTTASCPHIPSQTHGRIQTHSQNNTHRPTLSVTTTCDLTQTHCHKQQPWKHSLTTNSFTLRQTWCFEYLTDTHCHGQKSSKTTATSSHRHTASKMTVTDMAFQRKQLHAQTQTHPHRQHSLTHTYHHSL